MPAPELRTARLRLDAVRATDAADVLEYCSDPELQSFVPVPVPYTSETAAGYVGAYAQQASMLWAIRDAGDLGDARLLGVVELIPHGQRSAELGYWMGEPHRRRGFMTEAVSAVLDFGFEPDGAHLERVSWCAVVGNSGSAAVARAVGFQFEGLRRKALEHRDELLDGWFASLLRDDERRPHDPGGWPL